MGLHQELAGLLVVSMEQAVAAPYCGLMLADAGARVIKVERKEGDFARGYDRGADGNSVFFSWLNRGKESVALDLNIDDDETLLRSMLEKADVFLHNLAPGSLARRGFGGDALREHNSGLITCEINGYGSSGPSARKKAYDFLVQAESGICAINGTREQPARVGISICDIASGQTAFSSILRALIQRGRTGAGIDISIAISGLGENNCRRWSQELGIKKFNLQGKGCLGEKMKRQIIINKKFCNQNKIKNIIFIGTDLPDLCHLDLLTTIRELRQNDLVLGPSNDGGYWLIGLSEKITSKHLHLPFILV